MDIRVADAQRDNSGPARAPATNSIDYFVDARILPDVLREVRIEREKSMAAVVLSAYGRP
jgi:hypothetical protein